MTPTRIICLLVVAAAALAGAARPAEARSFSSFEPRLAPVASAIADRPVTVVCYRHGEPNDPWQWGAWAYVNLLEPTVNLSQEACDGALAIVEGDMSVPVIEQALGALALTHESFHLKAELPFARRASEAQTECRAVKRVEQTIVDLGATPALANELMPWALAIHFKETSLSNAYDWPGCRVPYFSDFWPRD
jgi:hypothetical protein